MESGTLQYSGTAEELKRSPELLHNAYLLRGAAAPSAIGAGAPQSGG
jgi:hypothetical protein